MGLGSERVVVPPTTAWALDPVCDVGVGVLVLRIDVDSLDLVPVRPPACPTLEGQPEGARVRSTSASPSEKPIEALDG
jgi:hypothetical protein